MAYKEKTIKRVYWTLSDLAKELDTQTSNVRYWCNQLSEFIKPVRNQRNHRRLNSYQRLVIIRYYHLLKVEKYTHHGAVEALQREEWIKSLV
jgi:hypothetical protein